jgi:GT2 family glycosyltransferase
VFNAPADTIRCLESLATVAVQSPFEVVVVDNGSELELASWLRRFARQHDNVLLVRLAENLGYARGVNIGAAKSSGETLILLNSDTLVTDGWLDSLIEVLEDPQIGVVSPVTNSIGHGIQLDRDAVRVTPKTVNTYAASIRGRRRIDRVPLHLAFFCVALRRSDFLLLNGLDERYAVGNFEDLDLCLRLSLLGYELAVASHVFVYHRGSASFTENKIDHGAWLGQNADKFLEKAADLAVRNSRTTVSQLSSVRGAPLLSIVVRTKDRLDGLALALRSLANQTDQRFEIVVVNDGGQGVRDVVNSHFEDARCRILEHRQAVGRSGALNAGVAGARTDLISYLDDDDIVLPFHVATLLDAWERRDSDSGLIYTNYSLAIMDSSHDARQAVSARKRLPFWEYSRAQLLVANRPAMHTLLHRRSLWDDLEGFDPELGILHDWDFLLRATRTQSMEGVNQETCEYRIYPGVGNVTMDRALVLDEIRKIYERHPVTDRSILAARRLHIAEWQEQIDMLSKIDAAFNSGAIDEDQLGRRRLQTMFGVAE